MGLREKAGNYFIGALFMSLAWSLRGQFGHLKGALIPGAAAAAIIVLLHREELWRKSFGWAVILSALGFSLGGHLSYGRIIEGILAGQNPALLLDSFLNIFLIGAIWGGLGLTFLGFGLSEKPIQSSDLILLAFLGLYWFIPLGIFNQEAYDMILYGSGLMTMHLYNVFIKKSRMISIFGGAGILGFGGGFLLAVAILYAGSKGFLPGVWPWWHLRDQILGMIGGLAVVGAMHRCIGLGLSPVPAVITLTTQKAGLLFYAVLIPFINSVGVIHYWFFELSLYSPAILAVSVMLLTALFASIFLLIARANYNFFVEHALDHVLFFSTLFYIWYLIIIAVFKQILPFGMMRWEPGFALFLIDGALLSLLLPLRVYRR